VIRRVTDRSTFSRFRHGRHARCGPLHVRYVEPDPAAPDHVRVAYAIGRRTGGAVVRNRARRRLRAVMAELDAAGRVPPGAYLISLGGPLAPLPHPELIAQVATAVERAAASRVAR
jgi:ribonuclease P protein component